MSVQLVQLKMYALPRNIELHGASLPVTEHNLLYFKSRYPGEKITIRPLTILKLTNSMAYETRRFNAAFTRALQ